MPLLIGIAFVAGIVTALSPCVLPVLPIVFAGGATGSRRRPYALVAGLVLSFTLFTLTATAILGALGLPDDLLRNVAIGAVLLVALSLLWPQLGDLLARPFHVFGRFGSRSSALGDAGGGFLLGVSLGLLFTPCAGPIIAAIATLAATESYSVDAVLVTLAYAVGAGLVLLGIAIAARRGFSLAAVKRRAPVVRRGLGAVIAAVAALIILGLDTRLAANVPGYVGALQGLEESASAQSRIDDLLDRGGAAKPIVADPDVEGFDDYGVAPEFRSIELWLNSEPLTLASLRGKVVLIDFWTYSCVNCLRTLPFIKRWHEAYADDGLVIVGVHTPEFAFEREPGNVRRAVGDLGVRYPVAIDNDYGTWEAWGNRYWPAKYFIDRRGHVRWAHFGEGEYEESEEVIRALLAERSRARQNRRGGVGEPLPPPVSGGVEDTTPSGVGTPETYLGYQRLAHFFGSPVRPDREAEYRLPKALPANGVAYGGRWTVEAERIVAGRNARLRLSYVARKVHLVLGTSGESETVEVIVDGKRLRTVSVTRDNLYTLADLPGEVSEHQLELRFSPGTEAYAFTFG